MPTDDMFEKEITQKRYLRDYEIGEAFTGFFVLRGKELRTRRDGEPFLALEFGDRSGRLFGNIWEDAERIYNELEIGGVIKLQGRIEQYRDSKQVAVKRLRRAQPEDEFDNADFLPVSAVDPQEGLERLRKIATGFSNPHLRELLQEILNDSQIADQITQAPGGKLWHHNRLGGLLEHTLSLCWICRFLARTYTEVDRDLLIAGAILHDIGKIEEYRYDTHIDYTSRGRLVGHIPLGAQLVSDFAAGIDDFPAELLDQLQHLVLSHQAEYGSPVMPMTREAFLLHYADQIDSKMDALRRIGGELQPDERWKFVRLLDRYIDFGDGEDEQTEPGD